MWKFVTVAMVAAAFAAESVGQEGGFQAPVNGEHLVLTEQAGEPGFYTKVEFVMGSSRRVERRVPVSHLTAGRFGSVIAVELKRAAEPNPHLYQQLLSVGVPFRPVEEDSPAKDVVLSGFTKR
jgi:hypothetical protein